jgi:hypothetical protein
MTVVGEQFSSLRPVGVVVRDISNVLANSLRKNNRQPDLKKSK